MGIKTLAYLMILCAFLVHYGESGVQISKQEELQWDKEFKLLQKPSVKIIKTKYGAIYDCVDFYKQPAFDQPLLKNHSSHPQIRPSSTPQWMKTRTFNQEDVTMESIKLEDGGCPLGTVPIRRLNKDQFFRIKRFTKYYASRSKPDFIPVQPGTHFAIVQTNSVPSEVNYHGVKCGFNVYDVNVTSPQYSSGEMIIQNSDDRIQVGWTVNPGLNGDNFPHLFQYINAGQSHCFNTLCPAFVSTNPDYPIDYAYIDASSVRGGKQMILQTSVHQESEHWWLEIQDGENPKPITVGYWPREIFTGLRSSATYIAVGGEAYSPSDQPLAPMGNGYYPTTNVSKSAACTGFNVLDGNYKWIDPQQTQNVTADRDYGVFDVQNYPNFGRTVFFGGTARE